MTGVKLAYVTNSEDEVNEKKIIGKDANLSHKKYYHCFINVSLKFTALLPFE